jgi:hypothetical protein
MPDTPFGSFSLRRPFLQGRLSLTHFLQGKLLRLLFSPGARFYKKVGTFRLSGAYEQSAKEVV